MYAGLTIADKDALEDAKARGDIFWRSEKTGIIHVANALAQIAEMEKKTLTGHFVTSYGSNHCFYCGSDLDRVSEIIQEREREQKEQKPRTRADVLLDGWREDRDEMARRMVWYRGWNMRYYSVDGYGENLTEEGFKTIEEAIAHQLAYLNSPEKEDAADEG